MERFGLKQELPFLIQDPVTEVNSGAFGESGMKRDRKEVIIPGRNPVAQVAFDHRKDDLLALPLLKGHTEVPEEFSASRFEPFEVTAIIDVIAQSAVGIRNPVDMGKGWRHARYSRSEFPMDEAEIACGREGHVSNCDGVKAKPGVFEGK
jgi:hypothetical protein